MNSGNSNHVKLPANIVCGANTKFSAGGDGFHVLNLNYKNVKYLNICSGEKWNEQMFKFWKTLNYHHTSSFAVPTNSYWGTLVKAHPLLHPRPENNFNFLWNWAKEPGAKLDNILEFGLNLHNRRHSLCSEAEFAGAATKAYPENKWAMGKSWHRSCFVEYEIP